MGFFVVTCPHPDCRIVGVAMTILAVSKSDNISYAHAQCQSCGLPVSAELNEKNISLSANLVDLPRVNENIAHLYWRVKRIWPEPPPSVTPEYLPGPVKLAFQQGEANFGMRGMEDPAAGSYRRALDVGTKQIASEMPNSADFEGKQLNNRIEMLRKAGRLTQDLADWSHQIKGLGNEAMHAMDGITREELTALRGFTELVLTYLFTLPGMLAARKADADKVKG